MAAGAAPEAQRNRTGRGGGGNEAERGTPQGEVAMSRSVVLARRMLFAGLAMGCLVCPTVALAKLPSPKTTVIVPGTSIGGVKIGMDQTQVFHAWGSTKCIPGLCTWQGPGNPSHAERATVSFVKGK